MHIISLPPNITVLQQWLETPPQSDRVHVVVQSRFANWTEQQLSRISRNINATLIGSLIGIGVSFYFRSKLAILINGFVFVLSLIGKQIINHEIRGRRQQDCVDTCFELEDGLVQFRTACEALQKSLQPFANLDSDAPFSDFPPHTTFQELGKVLEDFPKQNDNNDLNINNGLANKLVRQHKMLFGETRHMGLGSSTTRWISHDFDSVFGKKVRDVYSSIWLLKRDLNDYQESFKKGERERKLLVFLRMIQGSAKQVLTHLENRDPDLETSSSQAISTSQPVSTIRGPERGTISELAEQWRQNVAAFRSSLS